MTNLKSINGGKEHSQELAQLQKTYDLAVERSCYEKAELIAEMIDAYYSPKGDLSVVGENITSDDAEEIRGLKVITRKYKYIGNKNMELIVKGILGDESAWDEFHKNDKEVTEKRSKMTLAKYDE